MTDKITLPDYADKLWGDDYKTVSLPSILEAIIPFLDDIGSDPSGERLNYDRVEMARKLRAIADGGIRLADELLKETLEMSARYEAERQKMQAEQDKHWESYEKSKAEYEKSKAEYEKKLQSTK